jgi:ATP-dependent helicase/DNAse subunit B
MVLLTGPPGSGKTTRLVERLKEAARDGRDDLRLLVPTATMAEHLLHELARAGLLARPRTIQTLWRFVHSLVPDLPEVPAATLGYLARSALERHTGVFSPVAEFPGFQAALVALWEELDEAGAPLVGIAERLEQAGLPGERARALEAIFCAMQAELRRRGLYSRGERFQAAAERIASEGLPNLAAVLFDGFFRFARVELDLVRALAGRVEVVLALPDWPGARPVRQALEREIRRAERLSRCRAEPEMVCVAARDQLEETEEIARRILEHASRGRPFRTMGVVVRSFEPYVPVLRTTLERFGIPARFYFAEPAAEHPAVARLMRLVEAKLAGWDHERLLNVLRFCPASAALDRLEFNLMDLLPGRGLEPVIELARGGPLRRLLEAFRALEEWPRGEAAAQDWAERLKALAALFPLPEITEGAGHAQTLIWRTHSAALEVFTGAVDEAATSVGLDCALGLEDFWREVEAALATSSVRPPDGRRNVVHVIDVYEARQWELEVVFVCGLLERDFPRHHTEHPLLGDRVRMDLREQGIGLVTAAERAEEEEFLFEVAASRATQELVLSYPRYDDNGNETLRSFLLEEFLRRSGLEEVRAVPMRRRAAREKPERPFPRIQAPELIESLRARHRSFSPSSIDTYLECPFRFFASYTLGLAAPPAAPADRLDALLQGRIVHEVLEALAEGKALEDVFDPIFEEACQEARVPEGYRREAVRLELLANLRRFPREELCFGVEQTLEMPFEWPFHEGLTLCGRIDRLDVLAGGRALVIDYKYSSAGRLRELVAAHEAGEKVQGGLYLAAVWEALGYKPAGVLFCTLRGGMKWNGWHVPIAGLETKGESCAPDVLEARILLAEETGRRAIGEIFSGRVEPAPADEEICGFCDFADVCRVGEQRAAERRAGGARGT